MLGASATFLTLLLVPAAASASVFGHPFRHPGGRPSPGSAVVSAENGPYGPVLTVGGAGAGYVGVSSTTPTGYEFPAGSSLYFATVDPSTYGASFFHEYQAGCTTTVVVSQAQGPLSCTGSETDPSDDWAAFTTGARPVAGPGVNPFLLGAVWRTDLGAFQVTYAGHPLYLFDPGPDSFVGANFYEPASRCRPSTRRGT